MLVTVYLKPVPSLEYLLESITQFFCNTIWISYKSYRGDYVNVNAKCEVSSNDDSQTAAAERRQIS